MAIKSKLIFGRSVQLRMVKRKINELSRVNPDELVLMCKENKVI